MTAPMSEGDSALAIKCMDFCRALTSQGLAFSFSLSLVSNFSFSLDTRKMALDNEKVTTSKKRKSPSTIRRNTRRWEEFRLKKQNSTVPESSARPLKHLPSPTAPSGRRQVTTVGRNPSMPSFSQLDGAASPSPSPAPPLPPLSSTASTNVSNTATHNNIAPPLVESHCLTDSVEYHAAHGDLPPGDALPAPHCPYCSGPTKWASTQKLEQPIAGFKWEHGYQCLAFCVKPDDLPCHQPLTTYSCTK